MIRFENITAGYRAKSKKYQFIPIDNLSLTIDKGSYVGVVGDSGAGKSTFLRVLAGVINKKNSGRRNGTLFEGTLYFEDKQVQALEPNDRNISMIVQRFNLYPHLNVEDNIFFPKKTIDNTTTRRAMHSIFDKLELPINYLNKQIGEVSGGELQRIAVCKALLMNQQILLLDEAFNNLDWPLRNRIVDIIQDYNKVGRYKEAKSQRIVINVSHDLNELKETDIIISMRKSEYNSENPNEDGDGTVANIKIFRSDGNKTALDKLVLIESDYEEFI